MSGIFLKQKFQWSMSPFKMAHNGESIDVSGGLKEQKDEYSTTDNRIT